MKQQKYQSGSAHLIIIIILIIALLGSLGFVFWQNFIQTKTSNTPTTSTVSTTASTSTPATTDPTAGWKTYTNSNYKFTFKYPTNYSVKESARIFEENMGAYCQQVSLNENSRLTICDKNSNLTNLGAPDGMDPSSSSDLIIGGQAAKKYVAGDVISYIVLSPGSNRIEMFTSDVSAQNITIIEQLLSTFRFNI